MPTLGASKVRIELCLAYQLSPTRRPATYLSIVSGIATKAILEQCYRTQSIPMAVRICQNKRSNGTRVELVLNRVEGGNNLMKVIEIPFEKLTLELLNEIQQHGVEGIMDGDKKALRLTSVYIVDIRQTNPETSFGSLD